MTPVQVVLLVVGILGFQALLWIPLIAWMKRRRVQAVAALREQVAAAGERPTCGPEPARFTWTKGIAARSVQGAAVLTERRLIFQGPQGFAVELPLAELAGVREDPWFLGSYRGGRSYLILRKKDGTEVGVMVAGHEGWMAALHALPRVAKPS